MNATTKINVSRIWLAKGAKSISVPFVKNLTKVIGSSVGIAAALALTPVTTQAQTNLLADPGFELQETAPNPNLDGVAGWASFQGAAFSQTYAHSGSWSLWSPDNGGGYSVPGSYQVFAATQGETFTLSGWVYTPNVLPSHGNDFAILQISFFSGSPPTNYGGLPGVGSAVGVDIGQPAGTAPPGTVALPQGVWTYASVTATTPVGANSMGAYVLGINADANADFYFDDMSLTSVLVSTNLALSSLNPIVLVGGNQVLTVNSNSNFNYRWQFNGVNLTNNANVSGAATATLTLTNVTGSAEGTYTVVVSNGSGTNHASTYMTVLNPVHLTVDPTAPWIGFENWYYDNGGVEDGYLGGTSEAPSHLPATFNGAVLTVAPNTSDYDPTNDEFVNADGSAAAIIEADFYVQDDALAGLTLTFVGYCPSNSLVSGYTSTAFIEDFNPSYSAVTPSDALLAAGQPFSVSLATTAGDHIQYGIQTVGPVANPTNVAALGLALISINPPSMTASVAGGVVSLSFPTESGLQYSVLYTTNLTSGTWQTLSTVNGTAGTVTVTDSTGPGQRFYRLSIQ